MTEEEIDENFKQWSARMDKYDRKKWTDVSKVTRLSRTGNCYNYASVRGILEDKINMNVFKLCN